MSTHFNSSQGYVTSALILPRDDRSRTDRHDLHLRREVLRLSARPDRVSFQVTVGAKRRVRSIEATVTETHDAWPTKDCGDEEPRAGDAVELLSPTNGTMRLRAMLRIRMPSTKLAAENERAILSGSVCRALRMHACSNLPRAVWPLPLSVRSDRTEFTARGASMDKGKTFRELHEARGAFVIPNPWDIGTAKLLASLGFKALATTSAGFAFSRGLPDGAVGFEAMIHHCREMAAATDLPVSADLERGKGDSPESAAETIFAAEAAGLAGCSIEDHTRRPDNPIYDFSLAVERVAAAVEAARSLKHDFVFTARAENFLWGRPDLDDTIKPPAGLREGRRRRALRAGPHRHRHRRERSARRCPSRSTCWSVPGFTVADLANAGAKRISLGSKLATFAYGMLQTAAREMLQDGTFGFTRAGMPFGKVQELFAQTAK